MKLWTDNLLTVNNTKIALKSSIQRLVKSFGYKGFRTIVTTLNDNQVHKL